MSEDTDLIEQVLQGSIDDFGALVERYQGRLFHFVFHLVGRQEDAEEIVQETFIRAFRKLGSFRAESSFYTWLCAIASRVAMRWLKERASAGGNNPNPGGKDARPMGGKDLGDPAEALIREETVRRVQAAILKLPLPYRLAVVLVDIDGRSYDEAARVLQIPINTVRSRLARGRDILRRLLKDLVKEQN